MAKALNVSRADAYTAVADVWAMLAADAEGDIVKGWTLEMLDAVVEMEMAGCGAVMLRAGLVGMVDDGLVLPAELRHQQRDDRDGAAAAAVAAPRSGEDERARRRKEQNRAASRRYRKTNRVTGSKAKPSGDKAWRSLGHVAGHEVRVFEGQYGPYAMVLGATIGGEPYRKLTTGHKAWSFESVRLVDALPGLVEKWKGIHSKEGKAFTPKPLAPTYAAFRDDAERLTMLAKLQSAEADAARHADAADASARHADASASSAGPSAGPDAESERKSLDGMGFDASAASADRHADALSSMSYLSSSSSKEEEVSGESSRAEGIRQRDQGDAEPDERQRRERWTQLVVRFAQALGENEDTIRSWWRSNTDFLRLKLQRAGIDPNSGLPFNAEAPGKPAGARDDIGMTTESAEGDKPAAGRVGVPRDAEFDCPAWELRLQLDKQGIPSAAVQSLPVEGDFEQQRVNVVNGIAAGA